MSRELSSRTCEKERQERSSSSVPALDGCMCFSFILYIMIKSVTITFSAVRPLTQAFMLLLNGLFEVNMVPAVSSLFWTDRTTGISETLHDEISPLELQSICIDFGYFRTPILAADKRTPKVSHIAHYKEMSNAFESGFAGMLTLPS